MKAKDFELPCADKNYRLVTIHDCEVCPRRMHCDTYITIIEESTNLENESDKD